MEEEISFIDLEEFLFGVKENLTFMCGLCGRKFRSNNSLCRHRKRLHGEKKYFCICGKQFVYKNEYHIHYTRKHIAKECWPHYFKCCFCGQDNANEVSKREHENRCKKNTTSMSI